MNDRDFEIGTKKFKLCKIDALKQFHITRRIGPILSDLLPSMKDAPSVIRKLQNSEQMTESEKLDEMAKFIGPVMTGFSKLSDEDANFVLFSLLSSVEVQQASGNWAKVVQGEMLMIQDMPFPMMMQVAARAFGYNLSGFFDALPHS